MSMLKKNSRILIVDDSRTTRRILKKYLADAGFTNAEEAPNGELAWGKLLGGNPRFAMVFADWHMPNLNGLELLKKVRGRDEFKDLPFIMTTGERKKEEVEKAIRAGATGYIVKPFEPQIVYDILKKYEDPLPLFGNTGDLSQEIMEMIRCESLLRKKSRKAEDENPSQA
jgi:two-component system chemotaxis response regulator CheY